MCQQISVPKGEESFIMDGPQIICGVVAEGQGRNVQTEARL